MNKTYIDNMSFRRDFETQAMPTVVGYCRAVSQEPGLETEMVERGKASGPSASGFGHDANPPSTLLPMLIGGLVLIVFGGIGVMLFV